MPCFFDTPTAPSWRPCSCRMPALQGAKMWKSLRLAHHCAKSGPSLRQRGKSIRDSAKVVRVFRTLRSAQVRQFVHGFFLTLIVSSARRLFVCSVRVNAENTKMPALVLCSWRGASKSRRRKQRNMQDDDEKEWKSDNNVVSINSNKMKRGVDLNDPGQKKAPLDLPRLGRRDDGISE
jgi:hypothetical protein